MQRNILALAFGASLAVAALAACSSGGGSSNTVPPTAGSLPAGSTTASLAAGTLTLTINRNKPAQLKRPHANAKNRGAQGTRKPAYISYSANGLQVTVASTGSSPISKTIYADISSSSALCTTNVTTNISTCSITVPTLATSETVTATEVDQTPTGDTNGYGTGFPATVNILAAGTTTATITGGAVAIALGLSPVWEEAYNCAYGSPNGSTNAEVDETNGVNRILVTAGLAQNAYFYDCVYDATGKAPYSSASPLPSPLPYADVNASPEPITLTSSTQHVLLQLYTPSNYPNGGPTPAPAYAQTVSSANQADLYYNYFLCISMQLDGALTSPATVTQKNNLSAANPFPAANVHSGPVIFTVVPISVSPLTASVSLSGVNTATVTGSDYEGTGGMGVSGDPSDTNNYLGQCVDGGGIALALVAQSAPMNTTTWLQPFTITGTAPGTCTFYLFDINGKNYHGTGTESQAVTVTVNS